MCVYVLMKLEMLAQAGADILMPVMVGDVVGTAMDFAHYSCNQVTPTLSILVSFF